jgi:hypothetical protein
MSSFERAGSDHLVGGALRLLREHLGLDVAVIAQLVEGGCVYRYVDAGIDPPPVLPGTVESAADSFSDHLVQGRLP